MKYRNLIFAIIVVGSAGILSCDSKPKVIEQVQAGTNTESLPINSVNVNPNTQTHEVVVQEVLQATKYTYMHVSEAGNIYWVAVPKQDIEVDATYFFRGGLKKANFKSEEFDRVFETLYLVTQVTKATDNSDGSALERAIKHMDAQKELDQDIKSKPSEGVVALKDLFENPNNFSGKTIKVRGRCVKINKNIMGNNWVHIQDGSDPSREYDLTITTSAEIPVGALVEFEGQITLNKDFGAGYRYDVIMENGHIH